MSIHHNGLRIFITILCTLMVIFIFSLFANAENKVQYKVYNIEEYDRTIEID